MAVDEMSQMAEIGMASWVINSVDFCSVFVFSFFKASTFISFLQQASTKKIFPIEIILRLPHTTNICQSKYSFSKV